MNFRKPWIQVAGLAVVVIAALAMPPTHACSCRASKDAVSEMASADAVFTGFVVAVALDTSWVTGKVELSIDDCRVRRVSDEHDITFCQKGEMVVRLKVFKAWKGQLGEEIEVLTDTQGPACGFNFRVGQMYLVFAYQRPGGQYATSSCSRTALLVDAQEDVKSLGAPVMDIWSRKAMELEKKQDGQ